MSSTKGGRKGVFSDFGQKKTEKVVRAYDAGLKT